MRLATVGEQFDKYTLLAKLATGGMAELFVAELSGAAGFSKKVVVKRILPHVAHDEHFTRMFLDEAMTCAQINHPNVCQVFELCEADGSHFLVLEHLEGATVGDLIRRCLAAEQQLNLRLAVGIIVQACDGLHAAHEQVDDDGRNSNLVHRDVSPGNLFVTVDGIVKVLDFGIAKARWMSRKTKTGTLLGKCEYMSPEQARGGVPLDRRSDIFSLGIIAWELLCGRRLFRRESEYETLRAVLRAPIERPLSIRPGIPEALDQAIMQALERDPEDRFRSTYEFRQAMAEALREVGGPTPMCDIAPLIRKSFAEELKIQRAVLKQASQAAAMGHGALARLGSSPIPHAESDDEFANTDVLTSEHIRLPSLAGEIDDHDSAELTFRVLPAAPPTASLENARRVPTPAQGLAASASLSTRRSRRISSPPPLPAKSLPAQAAPDLEALPAQAAPDREALPAQAAPDREAPPAQAAPDLEALDPAGSGPTPAEAPGPEAGIAAPVAASVFTPALSGVVAVAAPATESGPIRDRKATGLLLALTLLLGAAVTTGSLMFFSNRDSANGTSASLGSTVVTPADTDSAPASASADTASASDEAPKNPAAVAADGGNQEGSESDPPSVANTAVENAAVQAEILAANHKAPVVVTALPPKSPKPGSDPAAILGTLRIRSSIPGDVYLYPTKEIIGTTPLEYKLEPGDYKLKVQVGPDRRQKKYFHVKIEADESTVRNFDHW